QGRARERAAVTTGVEEGEPVAQSRSVRPDIGHRQRATISQRANGKLDLVVRQRRAGLADFHSERSGETGSIAQYDAANRVSGGEHTSAEVCEETADQAVSDENSVAAESEAVGEGM